MTKPWRDDFIVENEYSRPGDRVTSINKLIAHYTANPGASAASHRTYFGKTLLEQNANLPASKRRYASAQIFVDKDEAICIIPVGEVAYAANDVQKYVNGKVYRGVKALLPNANFLSVSVELCIEKDGTFHPDTIARAVDVFTYLCKTYKLDEDDIVRHYDVTGKICPSPWVSHPDGFDGFKNRVHAKLHPVPKPVNIYTVKSGDSLWAIAVRYKTTVDKLRSLNNLRTDVLQPGDKLKTK